MFKDPLLELQGPKECEFCQSMFSSFFLFIARHTVYEIFIQLVVGNRLYQSVYWQGVYSTVYIQFTVQCTVQCTIHCLVHCTVQCTLQYTVQCSVQCTVQCIVQYTVQCTVYCTEAKWGFVNQRYDSSF